LGEGGGPRPQGPRSRYGGGKEKLVAGSVGMQPQYGLTVLLKKFKCLQTRHSAMIATVFNCFLLSEAWAVLIMLNFWPLCPRPEIFKEELCFKENDGDN
jgi:glucose dehydrogenase